MKQSNGLFFMLLGVVFLLFIFSQKGQAIWAILTNSAIALPVMPDNQNTNPKYGGGSSGGHGATR